MTMGKKQNKDRESLIRQEVVVTATGSGPPKRGRQPKGAGGTYSLTSCGKEAVRVCFR